MRASEAQFNLCILVLLSCTDEWTLPVEFTHSKLTVEYILSIVGCFKYICACGKTTRKKKEMLISRAVLQH